MVALKNNQPSCVFTSRLLDRGTTNIPDIVKVFKFFKSGRSFCDIFSLFMYTLFSSGCKLQLSQVKRTPPLDSVHEPYINFEKSQQSQNSIVLRSKNITLQRSLLSSLATIKTTISIPCCFFTSILEIVIRNAILKLTNGLKFKQSIP